jgi:predicted transcriptional regulator
MLPRDITEQLATNHAYTSIATVLSRLMAKGLVDREPAGRAYAYVATVAESDLIAQRIESLLDSSMNRTQVLSHFIGGLDPTETDLIRSLLDDASRPQAEDA